MRKGKFNTIDEYIALFPPDVATKLEKIRQVIQAAAPDAKEKISYQIPTFTLNGNLVHFAGFEHHIGFYPGSEAVQVFKDKIKVYKTSKGTIQFPLDQPIPYDLIGEITEFRVRKNTP